MDKTVYTVVSNKLRDFGRYERGDFYSIASETQAFESYYDALRFYNNCNPRNDFLVERSTRGNRYRVMDLEGYEVLFERAFIIDDDLQYPDDCLLDTKKYTYLDFDLENGNNRFA